MTKKIVLVEDDVDACLLFGNVLSGEGYQVQYFYDGSSLLNNGLPDADLYILDNALPRIDGIALTKYLKLKDATNPRPVIVMSGNPSIAGRARNAGASAFIAKPFERSLFLEMIHTLLQNPESTYFLAEDTSSSKPG